MRTKKPEQADRMLTAAARLFGTQRYHEVRMDDLAAEAGVGKGTIYRYFEDKDELYLALLARASQQLNERIRAGVACATTSVGKLEALVAASLDFFAEQPHVFDLIQRGDAQHGLDTPWQETRREAIRLTREILAEAQANGSFSIVDPDLSALLLLGGLRAVIRFGKRPNPPQRARELVQLFLFGAANSGAKESS